MAENMVISKEALQELMANQNKGLLEAIKELKKPSPEEQERIDAEKARAKAKRESGIREAVDIGIEKARTQVQCGHTKPDGKHTFSGRVLNNGDASVSCLRCQKEYRWQASTDQKSNGGALFLMDRDYPFFGMSGADMERVLANWEKQAPPKMKADRPDLAALLREKETIEAKLAQAV